MSEINRSLVILKPKQPFLTWARTLNDEDKDLTLEQLAEDSASLVPKVARRSFQISPSMPAILHAV